MAHTPGLRVGVAGATGALGSEIVSVLDRAPWRPDHLVPLASPASAIPHVTWGGDPVAVDDLDEQALEDLDALVLAVPDDVALRAGEAAVRAGTPTVDCSGALRGDPSVPCAVPWINPEAFAELDRGLLRLPHRAALVLGSVLGPLARAGIAGHVQATVLVPASARGRGGIDELSRQVVALLSAATPPRKVWPDGLAFDLIPALEPPGEAGWTAEEAAVIVDVEALVGTGLHTAATLVGVPVFSGLSASVVVFPERAVPLELIEQILAGGGVERPAKPGVRFLPRPRRVEGRPFAQVGRLRLDGRGAVHLWVAMDNLKATATAAVGALGAMLRRDA